MNSKITKLATALALSGTMLFSPALSAAEGDRYFGLQYSSVTFEALGLEWDPSAVIGRFGKHLSDNIALEGRFGFGAGGDTLSGGGVSIEAEVDTLLGIYGVGFHNINDNSSLYALIGVSSGEATLTVSGVLGNFSESERETDLSYGVGANIGISNTTGINLEYISYISKSDFDVTAVNVGFVFKF